jgi:hypothetical protein
MTSTPPVTAVGMWVTADGYIRQELLTNGRYDEARGKKKSAYQGRYAVQGEHIRYWDDTGFEADGEFIDGVLHHVGMNSTAKPSLNSTRDVAQPPPANFQQEVKP